MLTRCYNKNFAKSSKGPNYEGCQVCEEWLRFSNFKAWMEKQNWEGKELDKDILGSGKLYSPITCCFVPHKINTFIVVRGRDRGEYPLGVYYKHKSPDMKNELNKPYKATISQNNTIKSLGSFSTPQEAHKVWFKVKMEQAIKLVDEEGLLEPLRSKFLQKVMQLEEKF